MSTDRKFTLLICFLNPLVRFSTTRFHGTFLSTFMYLANSNDNPPAIDVNPGQETYDD